MYNVFGRKPVSTYYRSYGPRRSSPSILGGQRQLRSLSVTEHNAFTHALQCSPASLCGLCQ
jgi:hypothetical protein